jgi:hypothetical protein
MGVQYVPSLATARSGCSDTSHVAWLAICACTTRARARTRTRTHGHTDTRGRGTGAQRGDAARAGASPRAAPPRLLHALALAAAPTAGGLLQAAACRQPLPRGHTSLARMPLRPARVHALCAEQPTDAKRTCSLPPHSGMAELARAHCGSMPDSVMTAVPVS